MLIVGAMTLVAAACGTGAGITTPTEPGPSTPTSPVTSETTSGGAAGEIPSRLDRMVEEWDTDFSKTTIDLDELLVGIPASDPRDMIPPIDEPRFDDAGETEWLDDREPGILFELDGDARFYPLSVLTRHEIVNDDFGKVPVAVTYCPLCNTAVVFDRRLGREKLRLGVSGLLRNSDLVMWDDVTQSLWQQITGEGIVGEHAGDQLTPLPSRIVSWADFIAAHPDGLAMSPDQGFGTNYGTNPYEFYSSRSQPYGFFTGDIDDRFPALERVVGVTVADIEKAYPFSSLSEQMVINDEIDGQSVVVLWGAADTADALDRSRIAEAQAIGTGVAYDPVVAGRPLTFAADGDGFVDEETGSQWSILGNAITGELAGAELDIIQHRNEFWFAWQAFFPDGQVWESG